MSKHTCHVFRRIALPPGSLVAALLPVIFLSPGCSVDVGSLLPETTPVLATESALVTTQPVGGDILSPAGTQATTALSFTATPVFCCNPLTRAFVAELSGETLTARTIVDWDFGDGRAASGANVEHTFAHAGTYTVQVSVRLFDGREFVTRKDLNVGTGPTGSVSNFQVDAGTDQVVLGGEMVTLRGVITGVLDDDNPVYSWRQISGDSVTLNDRTLLAPSFTAPDPHTEPVRLDFEFAVIADASISDVVSVMVWPSTTDKTGNVAPVVFDSSVTVSRDQPTEILLTGSDFNGDDLTFTVVDSVQKGSLTPLDPQGANTARLLYSPSRGFSGVDVFTFQATDGVAFSGVATCTIQSAPSDSEVIATGQTLLVALGTSARLTMTGEAGSTTDLTFSLATAPKHGSLGPFDNRDLHAATALYTPQPGFEGTDVFEFRVSDGVTESAPAEVTVTVAKLLVPWVEINAPTSPATDFLSADDGAQPGMTMLDYCLLGIESWAQVTDTIIVTTMPGQSKHLYPELMRRIPPGVRIIGGLKTTRLPGGSPGDERPYDFADPTEWAVIADEAKEIATQTGFNSVLLENETALRPYTLGDKRIDFDRLATSLSILRASGVTYWWNLPRILPDIPEFTDRDASTTQFVSTIADALPSSVFLGGYTAWFDWRYQLELRSTMQGILGEDRIQERMLVTPDGFHRTAEFEKRCYTPAEAIDRLPDLTGDAANVFPGVENWVHVGQTFANTLPHLAELAR